MNGVFEYSISFNNTIPQIMISMVYFSKKLADRFADPLGF
jgi:hypothetical protein